MMIAWLLGAHGNEIDGLIKLFNHSLHRPVYTKDMIHHYELNTFNNTDTKFLMCHYKNFVLFTPQNQQQSNNG